MDNRYRYYMVDNRRFKVEQIAEDHYELIVFKNEEFIGSYNFEGDNAYGEALAKILSYNEISEEEYNT